MSHCCRELIHTSTLFAVHLTSDVWHLPLTAVIWLFGSKQVRIRRLSMLYNKTVEREWKKQHNISDTKMQIIGSQCLSAVWFLHLIGCGCWNDFSSLFYFPVFDDTRERETLTHGQRERLSCISWSFQQRNPNLIFEIKLREKKERVQVLPLFELIEYNTHLTWPRCCDRKPLGTTSNKMRNSCDTRPIGNISSVHLLSSLPFRSIGTHDDAVVVSYELTGSMTMRSLPFLLPLWWANISRRHVSLVMWNVGDLSVRVEVVGNRRKWRKWPKTSAQWKCFLLPLFY